MNQFGRLFRITIFGESHGPAVGVTIDGCPAGIPLQASDFEPDMDRRRGGTKGTTPRREADVPQFMSGLFNDRTTGAPLTIYFPNENTRSADYTAQRAVPRPGHADWVAEQKFGGYEDYRGGGHFSGRLTAALVAAGVVAKKILAPIQVQAVLTEVAGLPDPEAGLQKAIDAKDSVGGIVACSVDGLPAGLGEPFFDSAESLISHIIFSIPAIRGIEFGTGFAAARMFGSEHNDALLGADGKTASNNAGGIVGGISNGNTLFFRVAVKPTSSTPKLQQTWNRETDSMVDFSVKGRHDLCIALRVPVVVEAAAALVLADLMLLEQQRKRVW